MSLKIHPRQEDQRRKFWQSLTDIEREAITIHAKMSEPMFKKKKEQKRRHKGRMKSKD